MINLNDPQYECDTKVLKKVILSKFSEEDIFRHYLGNFKVGRPFSSPFRTDKIPSFAIFISNISNKMLYREIVFKENGDVFEFVKRLYSLKSFKTSLLKICVDMGISNITGLDRLEAIDLGNIKANNAKRVDIRIGVKYRNWNLDDQWFWSQYHIPSSMLDFYEVQPTSHIFYNDYAIKSEKHAYAFKESKDGFVTFKIYQPFSDGYKWHSNHNSSIWQGWEQLDATGDVLIITSSLKDSMCIRATTGINSVSLQGEANNAKSSVVNDLKKRFKKVFVLYDNDKEKEKNWGQEFAMDLCLEHELLNICIPDKLIEKDYSDLVKKQSKEIAIKWLNSVLEERV